VDVCPLARYVAVAKTVIVCVAGKNDIACAVVQDILELGIPSADVRVVCNKTDKGKHDWQRSLRFIAARLGIQEIALRQAETVSDLFLSVEFDRILRPERFKSHRVYNVHFSLLPAYRGIATAVWPLLNGEVKSGVTLHKIDQGIDTGDVVSQCEIPISENWDARDLYFACMREGRSLLKRHLADLMSGDVPSTPQAIVGASYYSRSDLDFSRPPLRLCGTAWQAHNSVRAFCFHEYQYPSAAGIGEIARSRPTQAKSSGKPGRVVHAEKLTRVVATRDYDIELRLSPYKELYPWARGESASLSFRLDDLLDEEINRTDSNGWTPLMVAERHGNMPAIESLIDGGADPTASNLRGTTPLMYARSVDFERGDTRAFKILRRSGADPAVPDVFGYSTYDYIRRDGQTHLL